MVLACFVIRQQRRYSVMTLLSSYSVKTCIRSNTIPERTAHPFRSTTVLYIKDSLKIVASTLTTIFSGEKTAAVFPLSTGHTRCFRRARLLVRLLLFSMLRNEKTQKKHYERVNNARVLYSTLTTPSSPT